MPFPLVGITFNIATCGLLFTPDLILLACLPARTSGSISTDSAGAYPVSPLSDVRDRLSCRHTAVDENNCALRYSPAITRACARDNG